MSPSMLSHESNESPVLPTPTGVPLGVSPDGMSREVRSQDEIVRDAVKIIEEKLPALTPDLQKVVEGQLRWAVYCESEIANTIIRNSEPADMRVALLCRDRFERLRGATEHAFPSSPTAGYVRSPEEVAEAGLARLLERGVVLSADDVVHLRGAFGWAVAAETEAAMRLVGRAKDETIRDSLLVRVRPYEVVRGVDGSLKRECTRTTFWSEWYPGLENGHRTMAEVYETLPGFPPEKVPAVVRLYENPESAAALPGAVSLERHDMFHILLGRGLLDQDEAFVIGFTMGTARDDLTNEHIETMKDAFSRRYPEPYRIAEEDLIAFEIGIAAGRVLGAAQLWRIPIEEERHFSLDSLRSRYELDLARLREFYREEARRIPNTLESARLPL